MSSDAAVMITRLHEAIRRRDVDAFVACFTPDYRSEQPLHPVDSFHGAETLRRRWADAFASLSTLDVKLLRSISSDDEVWSEGAWTGQWSNGTPVGLRGVVIFGLRDGLIAWGRLYLLPDNLTFGGRLAFPF